QDNVSTKLRETGSFHTTYPEQELRNPNISYSKGQPPLITTPPELGYVKEKVIIPKQRMQLTNDYETRSKTGQLKSVSNKSQWSSKLEPTPTLLTTSYLSRCRKNRLMQPQLLKTSPKNTPNARELVQGLRNRIKDQTPEIRYRQSPTPRLTSRISWTDQERKEKRREGKDLENCETDNEGGEILDRNGGQTARYLEYWETIYMKDFIQQGFTLQW
ncbi:MAG: hypothetical protein EZS28_054940, partial [Streblomastix strix]